MTSRESLVKMIKSASIFRWRRNSDREKNSIFCPTGLSNYRIYSLISGSTNFSHIPRIKGNSRTSRKSIDLFTGDDPARSINHKILIFTNKCNERQFYCSKPKKSSSSEEGSSSVRTVDCRRCHLLHLCHGCRRVEHWNKLGGLDANSLLTAETTRGNITRCFPLGFKHYTIDCCLHCRATSTPAERKKWKIRATANCPAIAKRNTNYLKYIDGDRPINVKTAANEFIAQRMEIPATKFHKIVATTHFKKCSWNLVRLLQAALALFGELLGMWTSFVARHLPNNTENSKSIKHHLPTQSRASLWIF